MEREFVLSCCSTVDLPYAYMAQRDIPVLFYHYVVGNQEYVDDMGRDPAALPGLRLPEGGPASPDVPDQRGRLSGFL